MLIDYKNVTTAPRRGGRLLRIVAVVVAATLLAVGGYAYRSHRLLGSARALAHDGKIDEARKPLETVARARVGAGRALTGLAVLEAQAGRAGESRARMTEAAAHKRRRSPVRVDDAFRACFARGDYELARDLGTFLWQTGRDDEVDFYLGAAHLALGELPEAQAALARVDPVSSQGDRASQLKERLRALEQDPRVAVVMDRERRPIAMGPAGQAGAPPELLQPTLSELLLAPATGLLSAMAPGTRRQIHVLTIDEDLQLVADQALGESDGFLIAMDPSTGEVLAHVSRMGNRGEYGWDGARSGSHFEPGSIIKVATYLAALDDPTTTLDSVFPLDCTGSMSVEDRPFMDWTRHGKVPDVDHALAVSCNLAFARLGLLAGPERIRGVLGRLGFGREPAGPFTFGQVHVAEGERVLANTSIGLEEVAASPIQVAVIAQAIASGGIARKPILVREVLDVLYEKVGGDAPAFLSGDEASSRIAPPEHVARLVGAMKAVVEQPDGTGRRARIQGLSLAAKTGTAGDRTRGLDAIVIGFAPADAPRIAVGLMASHAGKAEYEGARVLKAFFDAAIARGKIPGIEPAPLEGTAAPSAAPSKE